MRDVCTTCDVSGHPDHTKELGRLNRISGQIEGVRKMIQEQRYCPDIITQLRAARAAMQSLEARILETHLSACVAEAIQAKDQADIDQKIAELTALFKRYD